MRQPNQIESGQNDVMNDEKKNRPRRRFNGQYLFNDWSDGGDSTAVRKRLLSTLTFYYALCTLDKDCGHFDWLNGKVLISLFLVSRIDRA